MPGNNYTRSLVLYVAIEAVGWVTVALGVISAAVGLFSGVPEGSSLPINVVAATPGATLAVAGLFAAGLAHHGRITLDMARSLRHLVHLTAEAQAAVPPPPIAAPLIPPSPEPPAFALPIDQPEPEPAPYLETPPASPPEPPTLPPAAPIIPPLPPLPPLEAEPVRPNALGGTPELPPEPEPQVYQPPPVEPEPPVEATIEAAETELADTAVSEPDIVVYRNVQIELRPNGIFIRDRQFGTVDEARAFIDRVLDRAPR